MRKTIITILVLIILGGLGFLIWNFVSDNNQSDRESNGFSIGDFFSFGTQEEIVVDEQRDLSQTENQLEDGVANERLLSPITELSTTPVSGSVIYKDGENIKIRYVERATGHIFESVIKDEKIKTYRISNTTFPAIQEAIWAPNGQFVILQNLEETDNTKISTIVSFEKEDVFSCNFVFSKELKVGDTDEEVFNLQKLLNSNPETKVVSSGPGSPGRETDYFGSLTKQALERLQTKRDLPATGEVGTSTIESLNKICQEKSDSESEYILPITTYALPENISTVAFSVGENPDLFYMIKDVGIGFLANSKGESVKSVFESPLLEWSSVWLDENHVAVSSKPYSEALGLSYIVNTSNGSKDVLIKNVFGLVSQEGDGQNLLISGYTDSGSEIFVYDYNEDLFFEMPLNTFASKCIWKNKIICAVPNRFSGKKIEDWYKGRTSFSDQIQIVNPANLTVEESVSIPQEVDAINLQTDSEEKYLIFTNKKDHTLWLVSLPKNEIIE